MERVFLRKEYLSSDLKNALGVVVRMAIFQGEATAHGEALRQVEGSGTFEEQSEVSVAGTQCGRE